MGIAYIFTSSTPFQTAFLTPVYHFAVSVISIGLGIAQEINGQVALIMVLSRGGEIMNLKLTP